MDRDVSLQRVERTALIVCAVMAAIALALSGGRPDPAVAVLAGGGLVAFSYWSLKRGVAALTQSAVQGVSSRSSVGFTIAKLALRYALLALLAYVMIARLRLHPLGLLAGASSVVAAVSIEAARLLMKKS